MTTIRLDDVDAACAAATPGPWRLGLWGEDDDDGEPQAAVVAADDSYLTDDIYIGDAEMIALARTAMPALAAFTRRVLTRLCYESDDGVEYEHFHPRGEGEPECPACWVASIRQAARDVGIEVGVL